MTKRRLIDDLIVLGRAVPEPLKDGRVTVCLGGYSPSLGFIRIYPTRPDTPLKRWDIIEVEVEENDHDTREESWKIAGSRSDWDQLSSKVKKKGKYPPKKWRDLAGNLVDGCVEDANEAYRSLAIVKPVILKRYFADNPLYGRMFQQALPGMEDPTEVKRDFPIEPRVTYRCTNCRTKGPHDQQILEWGVYRWLSKNPDNADQVWTNLLLDSKDHDIYFFVGNQLRHLNSFLIISVLRVPAGPPLYPLEPYRIWTPKHLLQSSLVEEPSELPDTEPDAGVSSHVV